MFAVRFILVCVIVMLVASQGFAQDVEVTPATPFVPGNFALFEAAVKGDAHEVKQLIAQGHNVNQKNDRGQTAAHFAAHNQNFDAIVELIRGGANLNIQDKDGWSPLMTAASTGDLRVVHVLLEAFADPLLHSKDGQSAHNHALNSGHTEAALLIANVGLVRAIYTLDYYAMFLMLDAGANVNTQTQQGATALIVSAHAGQANVVRRLLSRPHIQPDFQEADGWTALMFAAANNDLAVAHLLMDFGVDLNLRNKHDMSALDIARQFDRRDMVIALTDRHIHAGHVAAFLSSLNPPVPEEAPSVIDLTKTKENGTNIKKVDDIVIGDGATASASAKTTKAAPGKKSRW